MSTIEEDIPLSDDDLLIEDDYRDTALLEIKQIRKNLHKVNTILNRIEPHACKEYYESDKRMSLEEIHKMNTQMNTMLKLCIQIYHNRYQKREL